MAYPSTFLDIQNAVQAKLRLDANPGAATGPDLQRIKDWINQAYTQAVVELEANPAIATMTLTASASSYTFPAGVARATQMYVTPFGSTTRNPPLERVDLDTILWNQADGGHLPQAGQWTSQYAFKGVNDFEVWPTPAAADVVTIFYTAFPTPLSATTDVPMLQEPYASKILEYGACMEGADFKDDPKLDWYRGKFEEWLGRYRKQLEEKGGERPAQFRQWGSWGDSGSSW